MPTACHVNNALTGTHGGRAYGDLALRGLTCMGFFLFYVGIMLQPYVIIHVKVEQWAAFTSGLGDDQVIKRHVVRQNQVLLHVHQVAN